MAMCYFVLNTLLSVSRTDVKTNLSLSIASLLLLVGI